MDITYLGHSSFKLRSKDSVVVMDPFDKSVGLPLPSLSADLVTVSHEHGDHSNAKAVKGTARRSEPFIVDSPGEYEVQGSSVFGVSSFHDDKKGEERGKNILFVVHMDGVSVAHLGDLGHIPTEKQIEELDGVDVLLCPVGGVYSLDPKQAAEVVAMIQPSYVVPMHYKTESHDKKLFGEMHPVEDFLKEMGVTEPKIIDKFSPSLLNMPDETEVILLTI